MVSKLMALAICELIGLKHLLQELRFGKDEQMKLICLSQVFMIILLFNLGSYFENIREQMLTGAIIPNFDEALARLLHDTSTTTTQSIRSEITLDTSVVVSQSHSRSESKGGRGSNRGRGQRPHCTYCHRLGHTRDQCYQLLGRPPHNAHLAQSSNHSMSSSSIPRSSSTP